MDNLDIEHFEMLADLIEAGTICGPVTYQGISSFVTAADEWLIQDAIDGVEPEWYYPQGIQNMF